MGTRVPVVPWPGAKNARGSGDAVWIYWVLLVAAAQLLPPLVASQGLLAAAETWQLAAPVAGSCPPPPSGKQGSPRRLLELNSEQ